MRLIKTYSKTSSFAGSGSHHGNKFNSSRRLGKRISAGRIQPGYWFLTLLLLWFAQSLVSQIRTTHNNYSGYWESPESWNPTWDNPSTDRIDHRVIINGFIKTNGDIKFRGGHLVVMDTLVIANNLQLGEETNITVWPDALLIVLGSVIVADDDGVINVGRDAYFVVAGEFRLWGDGELEEFESYDDPPKIFIGGAVSPGDITDDDDHYASLDCKEPGYPYTHSNCTYGNFTDFENDPLYPFYESLLHKDPADITTQPVDITTCEGNDAQFTLEAENATAYQWQMDDGSGYAEVVDGMNISGSNAKTLIISNIEDSYNGYLYKCKVTGEDGNEIESNPASLSVLKQVTVDAGDDASICVSSAYTIGDATVEHGTGNFSWSHNGQGTLAGANTLSPTYTPGAPDAGQTVILVLTAGGNADCASATDLMNLKVEELVTADAGDDASTCVSSAYTIADATVEHGNGNFSWSHNGQGALTDANTLSPTYTPGVPDAGQKVILTLTAGGNADCTSAIAQMSLQVEEQVTVYAGDDASICVSSAYTIADATAAHDNGNFSWSHSGEGTLTGANTLSPTYTPGATDAGQTVILTLTAGGNADCASATDQMQITVYKEITGSAIPDDEVCGTSYLIETPPEAGDHLWEQVGGTGSLMFSPSNQAKTPEITASEPGNYSIKRTLSNGPCKDETTVNIRFKEIPPASIEADDQVCGLEHSISALPQNATGYWQIVSGATGATLAMAPENHNNKIIVGETGSYELSWTADREGCTGTANKTITFNEVPQADAGTPQELFYTDQTTLQATLRGGETGRWEIAKGYGVFDEIDSPISKVTRLQAGENIFNWLVNNQWCENQSSVQIIVNDARIPNVITPNGDSKNDYFIIKDIQNLGPIQLAIFNRWGNKVYESADYKNTWDGRDMNNQELVEDTYYYYLQFANQKVIKGYVLIQR